MNGSRGANALVSVAGLFRAAGWDVQWAPRWGDIGTDLMVSRDGIAYAVELKSISEARPDRLIALLSQAILQARFVAGRANLQPLAMLCVGDATPALFGKIDEFSRRYAPDVAIGVLSENGGRHFRGHQLEALNEPPPRRKPPTKPRTRLASDLFSDLNQWMLKVLLAPGIPQELLSAPRGRIGSASELARAANVSLMSASRFVNRLREEHFLDDHADGLQLARRDELFRRWTSAALRSAPEIGMCFLNPSAADAQLRRVAARHHACLGLFAAADALGIGHVAGVVPYLYVDKLPADPQLHWKELVVARENERPDVFLRKPNAPRSVFRGAVERGDVLVSDVLQVWIDASNHPSRGTEQADYIRRKVIPHVFGDAA